MVIASGKAGNKMVPTSKRTCGITALVMVVVLLVLQAAAVPPAESTTCITESDPYHKYFEYSAIVLAEVIDVEPLGTEQKQGKELQYPDEERYVLKTIKRYKGDLPETFTMTSMVGTTLSYDLEYGRIYFLSGTADGPTMGVWICDIDAVGDTANSVSERPVSEASVDAYRKFDAFFEAEMDLPSPREQQEGMIRFASLECKFEMVPALTASGMFACVTQETKDALNARGALEEFDYSKILDRQVVLEREMGDDVVLRYWFEDWGMSKIEISQHRPGFTLGITASDSGTMLVSVPDGFHTLAKTVHENDTNTIYRVEFPQGSSSVYFYFKNPY